MNIATIYGCDTQQDQKSSIDKRKKRPSATGIASLPVESRRCCFAVAARFLGRIAASLPEAAAVARENQRYSDASSHVSKGSHMAQGQAAMTVASASLNIAGG